MSFKKKQVQRHLYSKCEVTHISCLACGEKFNDDAWHGHDGTCGTIEAENKRTRGQFYTEPKKNKQNLFIPGKKVQFRLQRHGKYKDGWYTGILKKKNGYTGAWEVTLEYLDNVTVSGKQNNIRRPRGKCQQEIDNLIPADELKKLLEDRERKRNPHKNKQDETPSKKVTKKKQDETPSKKVSKTKQETESKKVAKKKKKKKRKAEETETSPSKRQKIDDKNSSSTTEKTEEKKVRLKQLKVAMKEAISSHGGEITFKQLMKETKKRFGKAQIIL